MLVVAAAVVLSVPWATAAQETGRSKVSGELAFGGFLSRISCTSCDDVTTGTSKGGLFRLGVALETDVVLGLEAMGHSSETFAGDADEDVLIENLNVNAIVLWFPWQSGVFLKAGVGAARGTVTVEPAGEDPLDTRGTGVGLTAGIGLDLVVWKRLSISVGVGAWISALGDIVLPEANVDDVISSAYGLTLGLALR